MVNFKVFNQGNHREHLVKSMVNFKVFNQSDHREH